MVAQPVVVDRPISPDNSPVQLSVDNVSLAFGGLAALSNVSCQVKQGQIFAIIGPNGAGKTSLLNCINAVYRPQSGRILFEGQNLIRTPTHRVARLGIARTFQNIALFKGMSVLDNLMLGRHVHMKSDILAGGFFYGRSRREEIRNREIVEDVIDFLEITDLRHQIAGALPYGKQKRVELGRALALQPKVLLLDEPMAGMNVEEKEDMVRFILDTNEERGITIILIEHDMGVVMDISHQVVVLDFGKKIADGPPEEVKVDPHVIKAYIGEEDELLRQKEREAAQAEAAAAARAEGHRVAGPSEDGAAERIDPHQPDLTDGGYREG